MYTFAPILITVYNRKKHFLECIESLKMNSLASKSVLYVASDYPNCIKDEKAVLEIRDIIPRISGFKEIRTILNQENLGAHNTIINSITKVVNECGKVIFTEDDNVFSMYFLDYMNDGLNIFQEHKEIFSICGFSYDNLIFPKNYDNDIYLWSQNNPWGFATWKDRWAEFDFEVPEYDEFAKDYLLVKKFRRISPMTLDVLKADRDGRIKALDSRISFYMFLHDQYSVYPRVSLVRNHGFDGAGVNCKLNVRYANLYGRNNLCMRKLVVTNDVKPNSKIYTSRRYANITWFTANIKAPLLRNPRIFRFARKLKALIKQQCS